MSQRRHKILMVTGLGLVTAGLGLIYMPLAVLFLGVIVLVEILTSTSRSDS